MRPNNSVKSDVLWRPLAALVGTAVAAYSQTLHGKQTGRGQRRSQ